MPKQDAGYKLLFAHSILVRDFLHAFFPHSNDDPGEQKFQKSVVSWLTHSFLPTRMPNIELQELHTIEQIIMSIDNNTMDWSVQYIEQGREEGREEGKAVGREEGRVAGLEVGKEKLLKLISQLLTRKFGELPSDLKTKLEGSDISSLDNISEAILDLNSLSELEALLR